jgi:hypothetical protein
MSNRDNEFEEEDSQEPLEEEYETSEVETKKPARKRATKSSTTEKPAKETAKTTKEKPAQDTTKVAKEKPAKETVTAVKEKTPKKYEKVLRKRIEVDYWKTDLHGKEIGIRQKDQQRARSRQFSKDMDLFGAVKIGNEEAGNVGYRETELAEGAEEKGRIKRLIVRYFSEKENWVASMEEDTIKGLMRTLAHKMPLPCFNIFYSGNPNYFTLERLKRIPGTTTQMILPMMLDEESNKIEFFMFEKKRFAIGSDWKVFRPEAKNEILAEFDSKKLNIGGKVNINLYDEELMKNKYFIHALILVGGLLKYWDTINDTLMDTYKKYVKKQFTFTPNKTELELLLNPRKFVR